MMDKIIDGFLGSLVFATLLGVILLGGTVWSEEYWKRESLKALFIRHDCAAALTDSARAGRVDYEVTRICVDNAK